MLKNKREKHWLGCYSVAKGNDADQDGLEDLQLKVLGSDHDLRRAVDLH